MAARLNEKVDGMKRADYIARFKASRAIPTGEEALCPICLTPLIKKNTLHTFDREKCSRWYNDNVVNGKSLDEVKEINFNTVSWK